MLKPQSQNNTFFPAFSFGRRIEPHFGQNIEHHPRLLAREFIPSLNTLSIFGEPVYGDLNGDGKNDAVILLVNNPGGSGTFYYAVLAMNSNDDKYMPTNTIFLGDRIAPQTVEIHDGVALFNYVERKAGEPMTTRPSMGKSLWINYDAKTGQISELKK